MNDTQMVYFSNQDLKGGKLKLYLMGFLACLTMTGVRVANAENSAVVNFQVVNEQNMFLIGLRSLQFLQNGQVVPMHLLDINQVYCGHDQRYFKTSGQFRITFEDASEAQNFRAYLYTIETEPRTRPMRVFCASNGGTISLGDLQRTFAGTIEIQNVRSNSEK